MMDTFIVLFFTSKLTETHCFRQISFTPQIFRKTSHMDNFNIFMNRICDQEQEFEAKAKGMNTQFLNGGYKTNTITKANKLRRHQNMHQNQREPVTTKVFTILTVTEQQSTTNGENNIMQMFNNKWKTTESDPFLHVFSSAAVFNQNCSGHPHLTVSDGADRD